MCGLASREKRWKTTPYWARPEAKEATVQSTGHEWKKQTLWLRESLTCIECVWEWYTPLSVMHADRVLDIVTESWQDNKLISAAEAWRTSARVRAPRPPEAEKLSCTQAATTKWWTFNYLGIRDSLNVLHEHIQDPRPNPNHSDSFTYGCLQLSLLWRNIWVEKCHCVAEQSAEARFLLLERLLHKYADPPLEDKGKTQLSKNCCCFFTWRKYVMVLLENSCWKAGS